MEKRAQSALDVMILLGFIVVLLVPLSIEIWQRLATFREVQVVESLSSVREHVRLLSSLSSGSSRAITVNLPPKYMIVMAQRTATLYRDGIAMASEAMPTEVEGTIDPGLQTVELSLANRKVIAHRCGNNRHEELFEECDGASNENCSSGRMACTRDCRCTCTENEDCATNLCKDGVCVRCENDSDCSGDNSCFGGQCVASGGPQSVGS